MKNMKILILIALCVVINLAAYYKYKEYTTIRSIADKIIRFHVIANSDNPIDQSLKLEVRDAVLEYMYPKLQKSDSIEECREIILQEQNNIEDISREVVQKYGYNYTVELELTNEKFPDKTYGNITLPKGEYEAARIVIGEGEGQNWWCVMFPPLCLVDVTKEDNLAINEEEMKKVLSEEEYETINNEKDDKKEKEDTENKVIFKFKILELLNDII